MMTCRLTASMRWRPWTWSACRQQVSYQLEGTAAIRNEGTGSAAFYLHTGAHALEGWPSLKVNMATLVFMAHAVVHVRTGLVPDPENWKRKEVRYNTKTLYTVNK